jgi:hypothetical protein
MGHSNSWTSEVPAAPSAGLTAGYRERFAHLLRDALSVQGTALPWALLAALLAGVLLGMGSYVLVVTGQPLGVLVRDANAIAGQPNYFGALEHAEILLMSGAGWIAAFSSLLCRGQSTRFLLLGGLLSLVMAADDLYMLHESAPRFGIDEAFVFAFYGLFLALLVGTSLRRFLKTPFVLLGVAGALFAIAVVIDATHYTLFGLPWGTEDCLELTGICFWSVYFIKCSRDALLEQTGYRL